MEKKNLSILHCSEISLLLDCNYGTASAVKCLCPAKWGKVSSEKLNLSFQINSSVARLEFREFFPLNANKVSYQGKQKGQEVVICNRIFYHNLYDPKRQEQKQQFRFGFLRLLMCITFSKNLAVLL